MNKTEKGTAKAAPLSGNERAERPETSVPEDFPYADIIDMPHPEPKKHPRMSLHDRAAQFAPFAALTGLDDMMKDTAENFSPEDISSSIPFDEY